MSANDLILLLLVAAGAFYAGYQAGRLKALSERGSPRETGDSSPLPGPLDAPSSAPSSPPPRRGAPPPASAGNDEGSSSSQGSAAGTGPVRRSTKPPPAAAGLMSQADKTEKGQK